MNEPSVEITVARTVQDSFVPSDDLSSTSHVPSISISSPVFTIPDPIICFVKGIYVPTDTPRTQAGKAVGVSFGPNHPWNFAAKVESLFIFVIWWLQVHRWIW